MFIRVPSSPLIHRFSLWFPRSRLLPGSLGPIFSLVLRVHPSSSWFSGSSPLFSGPRLLSGSPGQSSLWFSRYYPSSPEPVFALVFLVLSSPWFSESRLFPGSTGPAISLVLRVPYSPRFSGSRLLPCTLGSICSLVFRVLFSPWFSGSRLFPGSPGPV